MKVRHVVLAVLFVCWTFSYLDRMVMTVAIPYIADDFNMSPLEVGTVISAFFIGYALLQIPGGMLADRFGPRRVMIVGVTWWTIFAVLTGCMRALNPMLGMRVLFGIGEGVFPASSWKTIATWFPVKERSTANGFMMSSNFLGPALAPLFVVGIMNVLGWREVFYFLAIPGIIMVYLLWRFVADTPDTHPRISKEELAEINDGHTEELVQGISFAELLKRPIAWQLFILWFFFDFSFWGFLSWTPSYLVKERGFAMLAMGITASLPFFAGTLGLILGGWLSDKVFSQRRSLFACCLCLLAAVGIYSSYRATVDTVEVILAITGLLQGGAFGAIWGIPMTLLPKEIMGTASGFMNMAGLMAGALAPVVMGFLIEVSGNYHSSFVVIALALVITGLLLLTVRKRGVEQV